jgi:hypothetical protein
MNKLTLQDFKKEITKIKQIINTLLEIEIIRKTKDDPLIDQLLEILQADLDKLNQYFKSARQRPRKSSSKKRSTFDDPIQIDRYFASIINEMLDVMIENKNFSNIQDFITGSELPSKITISSRNNLRNLMYCYALSRGLVDSNDKGLIHIDERYAKMTKGLKEVGVKVCQSKHKLANDVLKSCRNGIPKKIRFSDFQTILNVYTFPRNQEKDKVLQILEDYKENGKTLRILLQEEKKVISICRKKFKYN